MAASKTAKARVGRHAALMATSAPVALAVALAAGPAWSASSLPVPFVPPPTVGSNWANVSLDKGYNAAGTTGSVTVTASRAYAQWTDFSVAAGSTFTVNGQQPDWILVDQVVAPAGAGVGAIPTSTLAGTIVATGQVWLLNPSGIFVSNTGVFDVGGLLLSTANTFNVPGFLNTNNPPPPPLQWDFGDMGAGGAAGSVITMGGTVNASSGVVAFLAPQVLVTGKVLQTAGGAAQFTAVSANDVSLMFTDTGTVLALDLVRINDGVEPDPASGVTTGGIALTAASKISVERIFIAAADESASTVILAGGAMTATQARGDGQDIVLMTADNVKQVFRQGPPPPPAQAELFGGLVQAKATTTTTGGQISIGSQLINTTAAGLADPAAAQGAGLMIRAAGNINAGSITNAVGDIDLGAQGNIDQTKPIGKVIQGRDIALDAGGSITVEALAARDDVVARGTSFTATSVASGQTVDGQPSVDVFGAADRLIATAGAFKFAGVSYDLTGHDIDIIADTGITVGTFAGGLFVPGPLTAAPVAGSATLSSDVRLATLDSVSVGDITADRDILIVAGGRGGSVKGGALSAGRDVAVDVTNLGPITLGSATAGDDIVLRSPSAITVSGGLTTLGLDVTPGAAADQAGDLLAGLAPMTAFGGTFSVSPGSSIDVVAQGAITVGGQTTAAGAQSDARFQSPLGVSLTGVTAGEDVLVDAGGAASAGAVIAGRDVAVSSSDSTIALGSAQAGDDVVLRAAASIITGALASQGLDTTGVLAPDQAGVLLATAEPMTAFGHKFTLSGSDIDAVAGTTISVGGQTTGTGALADARFQANDGISVAGVNVGRDILVDADLTDADSAAHGMVGGALVAGRDIGIRSTTNSITLASAQAEDDIVLRGETIDVTGGLTTTGPDVTPATDPNQAGDLLSALDPLNAFGGKFSVSPGSDIDVVAGGSITVGGQTTAGGAQSDARFAAPLGITLGGVTASQDVLVDGFYVSNVSAGAVIAGRDIAIEAAGTLSMASGDAGEDIVLRAPSSITVTGALTSEGLDTTGATTPNQAGVLLATSDPMKAFGHTFTLGGSDIDVVGGTTISVGGQTTGTGALANARFQANDGISLGGVNVGRDILIDADLTDTVALAGVTTGALIAGRDVAVQSVDSTITLASAEAGDHLVLRSVGATTITGGLITDGTSPAATPDQAGDLLVAADPMVAFGHSYALSGSDIDVAAGGAITVGGQSTAAGGLSDARFQSPAAITLAGVTAGEDVLADAGGPVSPGPVVAGALVAGRDVAIRSQGGSITLASAQAGDDIVLRAVTSIGVTGTLTSQGLDTTGTTTPNQAGVLLATAAPMTAFGHTFTLGGSDIDVLAGTMISIGGQTTGTGALANARFQANDGIALTGVNVGRDILIDADLTDADAVAHGASGGAVVAGRDVAIQSVDSTIALTSAEAGDHLVLRSAGATSITGGLTTDGTSPAATPDQAGDLLVAADPMVAFGHTYALSGSDIDVAAGGAIGVGGPSAAAGALSDARFQSPFSITLAGVTAGEDVLADAGAPGAVGPVVAGALVAGRDAAIRSQGGSITLASAKAEDDIVLRSAGTIDVTGALATTGPDVTPATDPNQAGDLLSALQPFSAFGAKFSVSPGADIDVVAGGAITVGGQTTAAGAQSDARFQSPLGVSLAGVTASEDVLVDAGGAMSAGPVIAGRDVGVRSLDSSIALGSAQAGDDIVLRSATTIGVTGTLTTTGPDVTPATAPAQAGDLLSALAPMKAFGGAFTVSPGSDIDVVAGGAITVGGQTTAGGAPSDARFQSPAAITLAGVTAGEDVLVDGGGAVGTGALIAGRDIAVEAGGTLSIASGDADDDIVLRAPSSSITVAGALTSEGLDTTGTIAPNQAGVLLATIDPMTAFGHTFTLGGSDIDVLAGTTITVGGQTTGTGALANARFQANDGITLGGVTVGRDILIDADLTDADAVAHGVVGGALVAGRDVAVQSVDSTLTLASAEAGDHLVLRSAGATTVTGALTTDGTSPPATPDQAGDLLVSSDPMVAFGHTYALSGSDIDVAAGGAISVGGPSTATGTLSDARFQSPLAITLGGVTAGDDVLADAGGAVGAGALVAGRDVAVRSINSSITLASANAEDDIVLRSAGTIDVAGGLATTGPDVTPATDPNQAGDLLATAQPLNAFGGTFSVSPGADIDVVAGSAITVGGPVTAAGALSDARFQSPLAVTLANVNASEDILVDGGGAVMAGAAVAGRDIAIGSSDASITLASAQAGDDVVLRSATSIGVTGTLTSQGLDTAGTTTPNQAGVLLATAQPMKAFGHTFTLTGSDIDVVAGTTISVGGQTTGTGVLANARFQANDGITLGGVTVGRDILIDADLTDAGAPAGATTGALVAGRDLAIQSVNSTITLASAEAGDHLVLRSLGATTITGGLITDGTSPAATPDQAGDLLVTADPMVAFGHTYALSGSDIDVAAGGAISVGGPSTATGALSDARFQSPLAITLGGVTAGDDVLADAGGAVGAGALIAGRDVAIRSQDASVALTSAQAGDDIVLRSATSIGVTGTLTSQGVDTTGTTTPNQAGVLLATADPMKAFGHTFTLTGSDIDIVAGTTITVGGQTTGTGGLANARFQANDGITLGGVTVGRDLLVDADLTDAGAPAGATTGALIAGRDVAVQSVDSTITLASAEAGDHLVLRAPGSITVTGGLTTDGASPAATPDQAGDLLAAADPMVALGRAFAFSGADIDVAAGGAISVGGQTTTAGAQSDARFQSPQAIALGGVTTGEDVLVDAGGAASAGALVAGRDVAVRSINGSVSLASAEAGDHIVLRSPAAIIVTGALTTQGVAFPATAAQAGDLLAALDPMVALGHTYALSGSDIDVAAGGAISVGGQTTATGALSDARFQSTQGVTLAGVTAGEDVLADAGGAVGAGALAAGRDVAIRSIGGSITLASAQAGDDVVLRSANGVTVAGAVGSGQGAAPAAGANEAGDLLAALDPVMSYWAATPTPYTTAGGHDIDIRSGGSIAVGGAMTANGAGADVRLDADGPGATVSVDSITFAGGAGGEQILVAATDFNLTGPIDAPTADVLLFARQPAGAPQTATLGGPATGLGGAFTFDSGEMARTTAASLNFFSGTDPGASGNVAVQDLNLSAGLRTVRVFAGAGTRVEVFGQVVDNGGGGAVFDIGTAATDPNLPSFAGSGGQTAMSAAWTPDVVRISGGIGVTGSPFSDVALAGQSIFIAPRNDTALGQDFEAVAPTATDLAAMPTYAGGATLQISTGTLELRSSGQILERNLQTGADTQNGLGLEIGRLTIDRLTVGGPTASRVNLYGLLDLTLGGVIPPADPAELAGGILPAIVLHFSPYPKAAVLYPAPSVQVATSYRFNNCVFGGGGCLAEPYSPTLLQNYPGILPFIPHPDDIGNVSDPYTPVEEEPVTNVGGEVEWLPATTLSPACPNDKLQKCETQTPAGPSSEVK